tara:strand:- start:186 stop:671 length:486 start_codon:yes stop_codon:yes gene_type:complete
MALTKINNNTLSAITGLPAAIATGKVLQMVSSTSGNATALTGTGDIHGLTATLTTVANSSLYIFGHCGHYVSSATSSSWGGTGPLIISTGGNSHVAETEHAGEITFNSSEVTAHLSLSTVVTGLSAGSHTYKLRGGSTGGQTLNWHRSGVAGGIFIFEIGA